MTCQRTKHFSAGISGFEGAVLRLCLDEATDLPAALPQAQPRPALKHATAPGTPLRSPSAARPATPASGQRASSALRDSTQAAAEAAAVATGANWPLQALQHGRLRQRRLLALLAARQLTGGWLLPGNLAVLSLLGRDVVFQVKNSSFCVSCQHCRVQQLRS